MTGKQGAVNVGIQYPCDQTVGGNRDLGIIIKLNVTLWIISPHNSLGINILC